MSTEITGTELVRQALRGRNRKLNMAGFARDLGLASDTLDAFAEGRIGLPPEAMLIHLVGWPDRIRRRARRVAFGEPAGAAIDGGRVSASVRTQAAEFQDRSAAAADRLWAGAEEEAAARLAGWLVSNYSRAGAGGGRSP